MLHHTGHTRAAFDHLADRVAPGGRLFVMLYGEPRPDRIDDYRWFVWLETWRQRCRDLPFADKAGRLRPRVDDGELLAYFDSISPWINDRYEFAEVEGVVPRTRLRRGASAAPTRWTTTSSAAAPAEVSAGPPPDNSRGGSGSRPGRIMPGTVSRSSRRTAALPGRRAAARGAVAGTTSCGRSARRRSPACRTASTSTSTSSRSSRTAASSATARRSAAQGRPAPRRARTRPSASSSRAIAPSCRAARRKSELVRRITSTDPKVMMPAPDSHLTLDEVEKATLVRWIEQGAEWKPHWAFIPPAKPALPGGADHAAGRATRSIASCWRRSRRRAGRPSPEARRETLLRRVTFDLTGLPPTIAEIDAFLADTRAGRLRARRRSPAGVAALRRAHGRRLARRRALRRLARLPGRRHAGDVAVARLGDRAPSTATCRSTSSSPGSSPAICCPNADAGAACSRPASTATTCRARKAASSRRSTGPSTSSIASTRSGAPFLGLSVECARCHDHKYDPITQKEFFRLYALLQQRQRDRADSRIRACRARRSSSRRRRSTRSSRRSRRGSRALEAEIDPAARALRRRLRALARDARPTRRGRRSRSRPA